MPWKAVYVNSRSEKKISEKLNLDGVEAYVPLKTELKQWSDRKKKIVSPLISGYVFVNVDAKQRDKVLENQGVLRYVRYNGSDAILKDSEILILKNIELKGYHVDSKFGIDINEGDLVEIKVGQFKGLLGFTENSSNKDYCYVLIKSLDFQLKIKLNKEVLSKVE